jgi:hypothetical protein
MLWPWSSLRLQITQNSNYYRCTVSLLSLKNKAKEGKHEPSASAVVVVVMVVVVVLATSELRPHHKAKVKTWWTIIQHINLPFLVDFDFGFSLKDPKLVQIHPISANIWRTCSYGTPFSSKNTVDPSKRINSLNLTPKLDYHSYHLRKKGWCSTNSPLPNASLFHVN